MTYKCSNKNSVLSVSLKFTSPLTLVEMSAGDTVLAAIYIFIFIWDFLTYPIYQAIYKPWEKRKAIYRKRTRTVRYSLMNMRQLHIFSIKPKLDKRLFVDFCVFPHFSLNLPELKLRLFWTAEENNFRFWSGKFSQI